MTCWLADVDDDKENAMSNDSIMIRLVCGPTCGCGKTYETIQGMDHKCPHCGQHQGRAPIMAEDDAMRTVIEWAKARGLSDNDVAAVMGNMVAEIRRLRTLLSRADSFCKSVPPPVSDGYTNGLEPDIAAALDAGVRVAAWNRPQIDAMSPEARAAFEEVAAAAVRDFDAEGVDVPPEATDPSRLLARLERDRREAAEVAELNGADRLSQIGYAPIDDIHAAREEARQWEYRAAVLERDWEHEKLRADKSQETVRWLTDAMNTIAPRCPKDGTIMTYTDGKSDVDAIKEPHWRCMLWVGGGVCGHSQPLNRAVNDPRPLNPPPSSPGEDVG